MEVLMTLFIPYMVTAYVLISIALFLGLRPKCAIGGPLSAVVLAGICFSWIVSIPLAFWYHSQMAKRELHEQEAGF